MRRFLGPVLVAALLAAYGPTFYWMGDRWIAPGSPYSHGPFVVAAAGFLGARALRGSLRRPAGPSRLALPFLGAGTVLHLLGALSRIDSLSGFSLLLVLPGLAAAFGGRAGIRSTGPAVGLLLFGIPIPLKFVSDLSFSLKEGSAAAAVASARLLGLGIERSGPLLRLEGGATLLVGEACSGLRSLLALGTLAYAYAFFFTERPPALRALLVALSAPAALLANTARLLGLLFLARGLGTSGLEGWAHEAAALPLYLGAFAALVLLDRTALTRFAAEPRPPRPAVPFRPSPGPALALLLLAAGGSVARALSTLGRPPAPFSLVETVPRDLDGRRARDLPVTERLVALLETRDLLYRSYDREGESPLVLTVVRGSGSRKTAHPPETCYLGSGFDLLERGTVEIPTGSGGMEGGTLVAAGPGGMLACVYLYLSGPRATASYLRHQWDFLRDALSGGGGRSLLVRLETFLAPGEMASEAFGRLARFASSLLPHLRTNP